MIVTSGYGKNEIYGPKSDCRYFTDINKRTDNKLVKSYPCSNRPVICEQCDTSYWSYNLVEHYSKSHPCLECPLECDSVRYDVSISFSKIIPEGYIKFLKENDLLSFLNPKFKLSTENDSKNLATISVFYNDLEYTRISQLPKMDFFDLISLLPYFPPSTPSVKVEQLLHGLSGKK